jgi:hypothetical protein
MTGSRPNTFEERYRLYIDESGDHVFRDVAEPQHRFLCLVGCWFKNPAYLAFQKGLEDLKQRHFAYHPDEPVILHREDIINRRGVYRLLMDEAKRKAFDDDLIKIVEDADYTVVAVAIDKLELRNAYGESAAHPYHLSMGFMLQRYVGFLNHTNRLGDVMAETRGKKEDRLLEESYTRTYERGAWMVHADSFQSGLTSIQLKLKTKQANIAGLQLADVLAQPARQFILREYNLIDAEPSEFTERMIEALKTKLNRHLYDGRIEGYGYVLYPKSK